MATMLCCLLFQQQSSAFPYHPWTTNTYHHPPKASASLQFQNSSGSNRRCVLVPSPSHFGSVPITSFTSTTTTTSTTTLQAVVAPLIVSTMASAATTTSTTTTTVTAIKCLFWALLHVLGGCAAIPLVFRATSTWYRKIQLPLWTPPNRIFGPVWTILYSGMGIALARIIQQLPGNPYQSTIFLLWSFHYTLNLLWAPIFFGLKRLRLGLWINYMLVATLAVGVIPQYASKDKIATLLMIPYLIWLVYATILNQVICALNATDANGYNAAKLYDGLIRLQKDAAKSVGLERT